MRCSAERAILSAQSFLGAEEHSCGSSGAAAAAAMGRPGGGRRTSLLLASCTSTRRDYWWVEAQNTSTREWGRCVHVVVEAALCKQVCCRCLTVGTPLTPAGALREAARLSSRESWDTSLAGLRASD
jgi:hypothetical protein